MNGWIRAPGRKNATATASSCAICSRPTRIGTGSSTRTRISVISSSGMTAGSGWSISGALKTLENDFTDNLRLLARSIHEQDTEKIRTMYEAVGVHYKTSSNSKEFREFTSRWLEWVTRPLREEYFDFSENPDYFTEGRKFIPKLYGFVDRYDGFASLLRPGRVRACTGYCTGWVQECRWKYYKWRHIMQLNDRNWSLKMKRILLRIAAALTVLVSILHMSFWKIGNWQIELKD